MGDTGEAAISDLIGGTLATAVFGFLTSPCELYFGVTVAPG